MSSSSLDEIWKGDLFGRRAEAEMLIGYLESVGSRKVGEDGERGFALAVDCGYGEGKTYFLKALAQHLRINHPVAFIDAWKDDLADEPLIALAATLEDAIAPLLPKSAALRDRWSDASKKVGEIAKIAGIGLVKRGLSLFFTAGSAELMAEAFGKDASGGEGAIKEGLQQGANDLVDGAIKTISSVDPEHLLKTRIAEFRAGQEAIESLRESLRAMVMALKDLDLHAPIVIMIDELDRCRPTYAIKLLEEIKHLFDVGGIVFVFGMHGEQLAHSVSGAYGAKFNGQAYLRRFISRRYRLRAPDLTPLMKHLIEVSEIPRSRLFFPPVSRGGNYIEQEPEIVIALYMRWYGLSARDAFQVADLIQTCAAVTGTHALLMPMLLPMIISHILGGERDALVAPVNNQVAIEYVYHNSDGRRSTVSAKLFLDQAIAASALMHNDLLRAANGNDLAATWIAQIGSNAGHNALAHPKRYGDLLETVARFGNPTILKDEKT